jgi:two-component system sensor kinase FixL
MAAMRVRLPFPKLQSLLPGSAGEAATAAVFIAMYLCLDWFSYIDPLFGLNITPWNPDPALGLVYWLGVRRRAALPWFTALLLGEWLVRGVPAGWPATIALSAWLVCSYGLIGEALRRMFANTLPVRKRRHLLRWLLVVVGSLIVNGCIYIGMLATLRMVAWQDVGTAMLRFAIGDIVGVVVTMPLLWMMATSDGRAALRRAVFSWDAAGYICLVSFLIWGVFFHVVGTSQFKHLYFLFLPIIWAATRHGLPGTSIVACILQFGIILMVRLDRVDGIPFSELQLLGGSLALVGFFFGVMVDEQRQASEELKQSLGLAAAAEMAAALAHELNQPLAALANYGKACELLLARGQGGEHAGDNAQLLRDTMRKMVGESRRAAEVVKRLREFFRTGAVTLEAADLGAVVAAAASQFDAVCAERGIELAIASMPSLPIRADALQLEMVLRNLIDNAVDAVSECADGSRRVAVSAAVQSGRRVQLTVADSGKGIAPEVAGRLFESFVSGKSSGLGLGLALSRSIVTAHGGRLWADHGPGGVFHFVLPLEESAQHAI